MNMNYAVFLSYCRVLCRLQWQRFKHACAIAPRYMGLRNVYATLYKEMEQK